MRKILINSLGVGGKDNKTGKRTYKEANYEINGKVYEKNRYISLALDKAYNMDKIFYIGTLGSMWEAVYEDYCNDNDIKIDEDYNYDLQMKIMEFEDMSIEEKSAQNLDFLDLSEIEKISNGKINTIVTRYGLNDGENFENFNEILKIMNELQDGDEIYLDITHSFRSNALWMFLVTSYINNLSDKDIKIVSLTYGMLEAQSNNIAPVVDLNLFLKMTEWIKGAYAFEKTGNSDLLVKLLDGTNKSIATKVESFSNALNINYTFSIKENIEVLKRHKETIDKIKGPAKLIVPKVVNDFLNHFDAEDKDYVLLFKLAKWHNKDGRYAMVYVNIQESIKSYILDFIGYEEFEDEHKEYEDNNNNFKNFVKKIRDKVKYKKIANNDTLGKELEQLIKMYDFCTKVRNISAHSGKKTRNAKSDILSIDKQIEVCERIYQKKNFLQECCDRFDLKYDK